MSGPGACKRHHATYVGASQAELLRCRLSFALLLLTAPASPVEQRAAAQKLLTTHCVPTACDGQGLSFRAASSDNPHHVFQSPSLEDA